MTVRPRPAFRLAFLTAWLLPAVVFWCLLSGDYAATRFAQGEEFRSSRQPSAADSGQDREEADLAFRANAWLEMLPYAAQVVRLQAGIGGNWIKHPDGYGAGHQAYAGYGRWFPWFMAMAVWLVAFPVLIAFIHLRSMELAERRSAAELPSLWGKFGRAEA